MASTLSVSKGVFVLNQKRFVKGKKGARREQILLYSDPWYISYKQTWKCVEKNVEQLQRETFSNVLHSLANFIKNTYCSDIQNDASVIPTAALLTGINMPDHGALFSALTNLLRGEVSPHIAILQPHKCKTVRHTIEQMTSQLMNSVIDEELDSEDSDEEKIIKVKKSQSNMLVLQTWYYECYPSVAKETSDRTKKRTLDCDEDSSDHEIKRNSPIKRKKYEYFVDSEEQENELPRKSPQKCLRVKMEEEGTSYISPRKKNLDSVSPLKLPVRSSRKALGLCDDPNLFYKSPQKTLGHSQLTPRSQIKSRKSLNFSDYDTTEQSSKKSFAEEVVKCEFQEDKELVCKEKLINCGDKEDTGTPTRPGEMKESPIKGSERSKSRQRCDINEKVNGSGENVINGHIKESVEWRTNVNNVELFKHIKKKGCDDELNSEDEPIFTFRKNKLLSPTKSQIAKSKENSVQTCKTPEKSTLSVNRNSHDVSKKSSCPQNADNSAKQLAGEVTPKKTCHSNFINKNCYEISNNVDPISPSRPKRINELIEEEIGRHRRTPKKIPLIEDTNKTQESVSKGKYQTDSSGDDEVSIVSSRTSKRHSRTPRNARKAVNYREISDEDECTRTPRSARKAVNYREISDENEGTGTQRSARKAVNYREISDEDECTRTPRSARKVVNYREISDEGTRTQRSARKTVNYSEVSDEDDVKTNVIALKDPKLCSLRKSSRQEENEDDESDTEQLTRKIDKRKKIIKGNELFKQTTQKNYIEDLSSDDEDPATHIQNECVARSRLKRTPKKISRLIVEIGNESVKKSKNTPTKKIQSERITETSRKNTIEVLASTKEEKKRSKNSCCSEEEFNVTSINREVDFYLQGKWKTPQKNKTPVSKIVHSDVENSINENWICELSKVSPSTPLKIPKIILKNAEKVICEKFVAKQKQSCTQSLQECDSDKKIRQHESPWKSEKSSKDLKVSTSDSHHYNFNGVTNEDNIRKKLVVVIPEFEKFPTKVLQDFILILRNSIPTLPIVLIMGIATSVAAVHRSLPYRMSSCLSIKAFQSPSSVRLLNCVLEEILFSSSCPFWLGSRTFSFLMDVFLCYDLSVKGFVQAFKYCMMEHFCGQPWKILCCKPETLIEKKEKLTAKDIAALRDLPSFSRYLNSLEDKEQKEKLVKDDAYMKKTAMTLLEHLHETMDVFHISLKCLHILVYDLPQSPLGTQIRELYGIGVSAPIIRTPEYKECFKLLGFLSREELVLKIDKIVEILKQKKEITILSTLMETLNVHKRKVQDACVTSSVSQKSPSKNIINEGKMSRYAFKDKLYEISRKDKYNSPFEVARGELVDYLSTNAFPKLLKPPASFPLSEILIFDDLQRVRSHIVGVPRAAIHTALLNPQIYLQCDCCVLTEKGAISATMPDICIAFKLYRECGRMINLYDWLQSFSAIVNPQSNDDSDDKNGNPIQIDPQVHARFSRAVAELQFMGFLKSSGRKVDHVTKLCFDGGF